MGEGEGERKERTGGAFLLIVVVCLVRNCAPERAFTGGWRSAWHRIAWHRSKHADSKIPVSSSTGEADALSRPPASAIGRTREEGGGTVGSGAEKGDLDDPLTVDVVHVGPGPGSPGLLVALAGAPSGLEPAPRVSSPEGMVGWIIDQ